MRVCATSDLHGMLPEVPPCDLLLLAGDVCPDFIRSSRSRTLPNGGQASKGECEQADWLRTDFVPWLHSLEVGVVVGIAGNHDFVFEHPFLVPRIPWVYLKDQCATVWGTTIYGLPWVPNLPFWAFHADEESLRLAYEAVPPCDILMTHGPPRGSGDLVPPKYGSAEGENVGVVAGIFAIQRAKPSLVVCGHIHEGYGEYEQSGARVLNVSRCDGSYNPVNPVVEFDL